MFRLIPIDFSQKSPHFSLLSPTSPCELSERKVTSPSNLKVNVHLLVSYKTCVVIKRVFPYYIWILIIYCSFKKGGQVSTLTYFSSCPFGQLTKKSTCLIQSFSCPKKLIKITKTSFS
jgi:hypothetical protein